jgi:PAS domain S-box-containing protein
MIFFVPEKTPGAGTPEPYSELHDLLTSALAILDAAAGWIAVQDAAGFVSVPVRHGISSQVGLPWPQIGGNVWGIALGDEAAFLNELPPALKVGEVRLHNLMSCPLRREDRLIGHLVAANKPHDFTERDAAVLQGLAQALSPFLDRRLAPPPPLELSPAWRRIFDRAAEAIFLLDESGVLRYVNEAWLEWTGFRAEELLGHTAPFPFWVYQQDLTRLTSTPPLGANVVPFRRRDRTLLWCRLETEIDRWNDRIVTAAFLQRASTPTEESERAKIETTQTSTLRPPAPTWLPLLIDVDGGIESWGPRWSELTGLSSHDVEGSRGDLVLDWLFPQQRDRERVADCLHHPESKSCQVVLEIATASGSKPVLCTFLPCPLAEAPAATRRWLLLVDVEDCSGNFPPEFQRKSGLSV